METQQINELYQYALESREARRLGISRFKYKMLIVLQNQFKRDKKIFKFEVKNGEVMIWP